MKELLMLPIIMGIVLTFAVQLSDIAESTADKAIVFADDMNAAFDCASAGVSIYECSPELKDTSFKPEINQTLETLNKFQAELEGAIDTSEKEIA